MECVNGRWQCLYGWTPVNDCPEDTCWGLPPQCCFLDSGVNGSDAFCNEGEWSCADGESVDACLNVSPHPESIIGSWHEIEQFDCDTGESLDPGDNPIAELVFSEGVYSLTWASGMFETYKDYWGPYSYDPASGAFAATIELGNYTPSDFDGEGTVFVEENGDIRFDGVWFGTPPDRPEPVIPVPCGHRMSQEP